MKVKLIFTLPEEQDEFNNSIKGSEWQDVCWQMNKWLRNNTKYAPEICLNKSIKHMKNVENIYKNLWEKMD